jgi:ferric-dicitrate binding protein FerR (iron transport regulator)
MKRANALACLPKKLIDKPGEAAEWMAQKRAKDAASAKIRRLQNLDRYRANERRNYERTKEGYSEILRRGAPVNKSNRYIAYR